MLLSPRCSLYLVSAGLLWGAAATAPAATLTWGAPTTISADTNVVNAGVTVGAFRLGSTGLAAAAVNGVTFAPVGLAEGTNVITFGNFTFNAGASSSTNTAAGSTAAPYSNLSIPLKNLLQAGTFSELNRMTLTMGGLTVGRNYTFQWFSSNAGIFSDYAGALVRATGGTGEVTIDTNTGGSVGAGQAFGGIGQFATGTFTADATSQVITFVSPNDYTYLTAFQLRTIPEPSTTLLGALAGLTLLRRRGR